MNDFLRKRSLGDQITTVLPSSAFLNLTSHVNYKEDSPVFTCRFNPDPHYTNIFAFGKENGEVCIKDTRKFTYEKNGTIPNSNLTLKTFEADRNAIVDCQWQLSYNDRLFVASGNGSVLLWNIHEHTPISTFKSHETSVKCLSVCPDEPHLFATSGRDGYIKVWDSRTKEDGSVGSVETTITTNVIAKDGFSGISPKTNPKKKRVKKPVNCQPLTVSAILLHGESLISGTNKSEGIRFWDLRYYKTSSPCRIILPPADGKGCAGFTSFCTDPYGRHTLYATCKDNIIYAYSLTTKSNEPVKKYMGAQIDSFHVQTTICPTMPYLLSGSSDGSALIWSMNSDYPSYVLDDQLNEVQSVAWNDQFEILTFSDMSWRLWKLDRDADRFTTPTTIRCHEWDDEVLLANPGRKRTRRMASDEENELSR